MTADALPFSQFQVIKGGKFCEITADVLPFSQFQVIKGGKFCADRSGCLASKRSVHKKYVSI